MQESSDEERGHAMKVSGAISYSKFRIYVNVIVFKFIAYLPFVADEVPEPAWRQDRSARHQGKRMKKREGGASWECCQSFADRLCQQSPTGDEQSINNLQPGVNE